jgi:hypothetical protein
MPMRSAVVSTLVTLSLAVGVVLADSKAEQPAKPPTTGPTTTQVATTQSVNKYCAVMGPDDLVDPKYNLVHNKQVIGFCCEECVDAFKEKPERFLKKMK